MTIGSTLGELPDFEVVKHISNSLDTLKLPPTSNGFGPLVTLGNISFYFGFYSETD